MVFPISPINGQLYTTPGNVTYQYSSTYTAWQIIGGFGTSGYSGISGYSGYSGQLGISGQSGYENGAYTVAICDNIVSTAAATVLTVTTNQNDACQSTVRVITGAKNTRFVSWQQDDA